MKATIHPAFYPAATITCACGKVHTTGSTLQGIQTEICSNCHPFYTGKQNLVDTAGTVDKFQRRKALAAEKKAAVSVKKPRKARATK